MPLRVLLLLHRHEAQWGNRGVEVDVLLGHLPLTFHCFFPLYIFLGRTLILYSKWQSNFWFLQQLEFVYFIFGLPIMPIQEASEDRRLSGAGVSRQVLAELSERFVPRRPVSKKYPRGNSSLAFCRLIVDLSYVKHAVSHCSTQWNYALSERYHVLFLNFLILMRMLFYMPFLNVAFKSTDISQGRTFLVPAFAIQEACAFCTLQAARSANREEFASSNADEFSGSKVREWVMTDVGREAL